MREKNNKNLNGVRCVKSVEDKIVIRDGNIKQQWPNYLEKLFNGDDACNMVILLCPRNKGNHDLWCKIRESGVEMFLKKININKVLGSGNISLWKFEEFLWYGDKMISNII